MLFGLCCLFTFFTTIYGQEVNVPAEKKGTLYFVTMSHLDTQWHWTIQDTIERHIPKTFSGNFALMDKFPDFHFSFETAHHYMLLKEYHPELYEKARHFVEKGQLHICGSTLTAGDVLLPSPESLIRQVIYGNGWWEKEFGKTSVDIFLPDCFGFGYTLPSVAAHCGLTGFSTRKLGGDAPMGVPFHIGRWEGIDGSSLVAVLDGGNYRMPADGDISRDPKLLEKIVNQGRISGSYVAYQYFGTGDDGGSVKPTDVENLLKSMHSDGPIKVLSAPADQLYKDITPEQVLKMPSYKGELLLRQHGTGCYTAQSAMKYWNRKNEQAGDAAERISVLAQLFAGSGYPQEKLDSAWIRFLWHQFHDDLTGTSTPLAYTFSWNDEILSNNQFNDVIADGIGQAAQLLDTRVQGIPAVIYNPLSIERSDIVTVKVNLPGAQAVKVFDTKGQEVLSQILNKEGTVFEIAFVAEVPSVGLSMYDLRPANEFCAMHTDLKASEIGIENSRYKVTIGKDGDIVSIFDKAAQRELLSGPMSLEMLNNESKYWQAWEISYKDVSTKPRAIVKGPVKVRIVEQGPLRASVAIERQSEGSTFEQIISLNAAGPQDRVDIKMNIDWQTQATLLKAVFPMTAANANATYDLGWGVIQRPNNTSKQYEVPAQQWADLSDASLNYGIAILNDCKYGWDKPSDNTLRMTLFHTPEPGRGYHDQTFLDFGKHEVQYSIYGHEGDWKQGKVHWQAARLNQPLRGFTVEKHEGELGHMVSLVKLSSDQVGVMALKKAQKNNEIIVRVRELEGKTVNGVRLSMVSRIASANETNGVEEKIMDAIVNDGNLMFNLKPWQVRTFAMTMAQPDARIQRPVCRVIDLQYNTDVFSFDANKGDGDFDGKGHTLPAELIGSNVTSEGIVFKMGPREDGQNNAVQCKGQEIGIPEGDFNKVYILAAAVGDVNAAFSIDDKPTELSIQDFTGFIGQADKREFADCNEGKNRHPKEFVGITPGYNKDDCVAWVGTHLHSKTKNEPYIFCYLYKYALDIANEAKTITLPDNDKVRVLAITAARNYNDSVSY